MGDPSCWAAPPKPLEKITGSFFKSHPKKKEKKKKNKGGPSVTDFSVANYLVVKANGINLFVKRM